jgi:hypothetical protein
MRTSRGTTLQGWTKKSATTEDHKDKTDMVSRLKRFKETHTLQLTGVAQY